MWEGKCTDLNTGKIEVPELLTFVVVTVVTALLVISIRRSEAVIRSQRHISDALLMDNSSLLHLNARSFPGVSLWVREICQWAERSILVTGPKTDLESTLTVKALVMPLYSGFHIVQSDLLVGVPPAKKKMTDEAMCSSKPTSHY